MHTKRTAQVPRSLAGKRLDTALAVLFPDTSRAQWQKRITSEDVFVNLALQSAAYRVRAGDTVVVREMPARPFVLEPDARVVVPILFEDADVIVVNKPAGLLVHPTDGNETGTLVHGLVAHAPQMLGLGDDSHRPGIVHRLDRDTSGVLVVAKSARGFDDLKRQFHDRTAHKVYWALIAGRLKDDRGVITLPIARSRRDPRRRVVPRGKVPHSRVATTRYTVLQRFRTTTLVAAEPVTGRTHQLRVHFHALHHPIVGDPLYGGRTVPRVGLSHQFLHAKELTLQLPSERTPRTFTAPLPDDLRAVLASLS